MVKKGFPRSSLSQSALFPFRENFGSLKLNHMCLQCLFQTYGGTLDISGVTGTKMVSVSTGKQKNR